MENIKYVNVFYNNRKVGTLAQKDRYSTAFQYDNEWIKDVPFDVL